ncbi:MAG TPA: YbaK/EbsC family protein [Jatrophihabitans sp.]|nr:YbaK/EbsC family protein [Jatrophihabitans sp.]
MANLDWTTDLGSLVAAPVTDALAAWGRTDVRAAPIDPELADTAAFCAEYGVAPEDSANCVVVAGKREGERRYAACVVLATTRADVNGVVRRRLDVRKASFAPMEDAVALTGMEYGGITPIGLPASWPVLVDRAVLDRDVVVVGSGLRRSKIALPAAALAELPGAEVIDGLAS